MPFAVPATEPIGQRIGPPHPRRGASSYGQAIAHPLTKLVDLGSVEVATGGPMVDERVQLGACR